MSHFIGLASLKRKTYNLRNKLTGVTMIPTGMEVAVQAAMVSKSTQRIAIYFTERGSTTFPTINNCHVMLSDGDSVSLKMKTALRLAARVYNSAGSNVTGGTWSNLHIVVGD